MTYTEEVKLFFKEMVMNCIKNIVPKTSRETEENRAISENS